MPAEELEKEFQEFLEATKERKRVQEEKAVQEARGTLEAKVAELTRALEEARATAPGTSEGEEGKLRAAETAAQEAVRAAAKASERLARAMAELGGPSAETAASDADFDGAIAAAKERVARIAAELEVHRKLLSEQTTLRAGLESQLSILTAQLQSVGGAINVTSQEADRERAARLEAETALAATRDVQLRTDASVTTLQQELSAARSRQKAAEQRGAQLQAELTQLGEKAKALWEGFTAEQTARKASEGQRTALEKELVDAHARRASIEAALSETQSVTTRLDAQVRDQMNEAATLREETRRAVTENDSLQLELQRYQVDLQRTTGTLLEAQSEQGRHEMLASAHSAKAKKLAEELAETQARHDAASRERDRLLGRVAEQEGEIERAVDAADKSRLQTRRAETELAERRQQFDDAHKSLEMLAQRLSDSESVRKAREEESAALSLRAEALGSDVLQLRRSLAMAESRLSDDGTRTASEAAAWEQERGMLRGKLAESETERARLTETLHARQKEQAHAEGEAATLGAERDRMRKDLADREERLKDFDGKRERLQVEWDRSLKSERDARAAAQESLRMQTDRAQTAERMSGELEARGRQERSARQEAERLVEAGKLREMQMIGQRMELEAALVEAQAASRMADSELQPVRERERELKSALSVLERRVDKERELREESQLALEVFRIREVEWGAEREALEKKLRRLPAGPELSKSEAEAKFQKDRATLARHLRLVHEARLKISQSLHASENLERELAGRINELERNLDYERETKALLSRSEEDARRMRLAADQERDRGRLSYVELSAEADSLRRQVEELQQDLARTKSAAVENAKRRDDSDRGVHIPGVITPTPEHDESSLRDDERTERTSESS